MYLFVGSCCLGTLWSFSIPLSRMYVGVHSPLDCIAGAILGVFVLSMWYALSPAFLNWNYLSGSDYVFPVMIIWVVCTVSLHPRSHRYSPSFRHNLAVIGLIAGVVIGISMRPFQ